MIYLLKINYILKNVFIMLFLMDSDYARKEMYKLIKIATEVI
jgi:hypothetical protein